jgi:hypothetical protein
MKRYEKIGDIGDIGDKVRVAYIADWRRHGDGGITIITDITDITKSKLSRETVKSSGVEFACRQAEKKKLEDIGDIGDSGDSRTAQRGPDTVSSFCLEPRRVSQVVAAAPLATVV